MAAIDVRVEVSGPGWAAEVWVRDRSETRHRVRVSPEELARYGGEHPRGPGAPRGSSAEVAELVRRSFEFLLEREPNTSILAAFDLSAIERYFPEYREVIRRAGC